MVPYGPNEPAEAREAPDHKNAGPNRPDGEMPYPGICFLRGPFFSYAVLTWKHVFRTRMFKPKLQNDGCRFPPDPRLAAAVGGKL